MDAGLADPTDWHGSRLPALASLDGCLRCQVCKDFLSNAVITSCLHTFCSLCIRRCLATEGKCPTCRATEQEVKLRRNVGMQEATDAFLAARSDTLHLAKEEPKIVEVASEVSRKGSKRKRVDAEVDEEGISEPRTRNQRRKADALQDHERHEQTVIDDSEGDDEEDPEFEPEDGLVACPMCKKRMKEESVFLHLDTCTGEARTTPPAPSRASVSKASTQPTQNPPPERLPQLNYSLYNENNLRKKLSALGIPTWGPKQLLIKRHTEWINLWNAECDSAHARSKRQLLQDLDAWERSQGGRARESKDSAIMTKDFDGSGWAKQNKSDFDQLIANARQKRKEPTPDKEGSEPANKDKTEDTTVSPSTKPKLSPLKTPQSVSNGMKERLPPSMPAGPAASSDPGARASKNLPPLTPQVSSFRSTSTGQDISPSDPLPRRFSLSGGDVRQVPMFEVPSTPVLDSDRGK